MVRNVDINIYESAAYLEWTYQFKKGVNSPAAVTNGETHVPAVAVPTVHKTKFQGPGAHLRALESIVPKVTQLLIIGWRSAE